ncbi:SusC/RagA family TonB-linked outer membrane protein [Hymenobacter lapidiphilus]|uniref:SusC/RagA family TonB-linked outer membrane protein n=1 Tax=Hymenobacter lapidiphilus TaxID=2608003 RepID=A0A7Y7U4R0_9BACT|nr:SusC/RagA family TonB-linked outer membrane protein [Hymenobacter lapidiphilus]NVO30522.1 SusC/RagA family TonB-linked outer membrane protein [Hymenobacter lapidiphilus]
MKKFLFSVLPLVAFSATQVAAQTRTVSGRVTDRGTGEGLPGVTVLLKGSSNGISTNSDGSYTLTVPTTGGTLVFSSIGFVSVERQIGTDSQVSVGLSADSKQLSEVVVTAFGIERDKKELTYTVQEVQGENLVQAGQPNVTNALQGRVAGVTVRSSSGMPGSSSQVTIRGSRFFSGQNQPLYVVDGLPIESNSDFSGGVSGTDASSRALDINPNDIENISVLKGAAAAALYGNRAVNGVILITTKRGAGIGKPAQVSYATDYSFDSPSVLPDLQSTYAQGSGGAFNANTSLSWGPRLTALDPTVLDKGGKPLVPGKAYDNVKPLFRTGHTMNHSLSLAGNGTFGNYAVGLGYTNQSGIIPTTGMQRYTAKVSGDFKVTPKLTVGASLNYSDLDIDKLPAGSNLSNPLFTTYYAPRSYDLWGIPFENPNNIYNQIHYRAAIDNPRWALKHNYFNEKTNRVFGNVNSSYKFTDFLTLNYRIGVDQYTTQGKEVYDLGSGFTGGRTATPSGGQVNDYSVIQSQVNSNVNLSFNKNLTEDINLNVLVGNEFYNITNRFQNMLGQGITIGGLRNIGSTITQTTAETLSRTRTVGFFGNLIASYKDMLFLNSSLRQDYFSTLEPENRKLLYPSVGLGFVLTEAFNIPQNVVTFAKVRGSYAEAAQAPGPYSTRTIFARGGADSGFLSDGINFPFNGQVGLSQSDILRTQDLEPVNLKTYEVGADLRFLNNRVTVDYTYFTQRIVGQIFSVPAAPSTGFTQRFINSGEMSSTGNEIVLGVTPFQSAEGFNWNLTANFTQYRNKVVSLAEGVDNIFLGGFVEPSVRAQLNNLYPVLYGTRFKRNPAGAIVVDSDGYPMADDELGVIGTVQPKFELGLTNTFSFKNLSLLVQVDTRQGAQAYAGNTRLAKLYGMDKITEDRESDFVFDGVTETVDAAGNVSYAPNTTVIKRDQDYWQFALDGITESNIYSTDFVRLREVSLSYSLPQSLVTKSKVFSAASVSLIGRNLFLITDYPNFDPETSIGGAGNFQGLEYVALPQLRSYGASLRVTF